MGFFGIVGSRFIFISVEVSRDDEVTADIMIDIQELAVDVGGFGAGGAAAAPEAVADFGDKVFLEKTFWAEMDEKGGKEAVVFFLIFLVGRGIDDGVVGVEAMFDGVVADDILAFIGFRPGGKLGVCPIGDKLFLANGHIPPLIRCDLLTGGKAEKPLIM